MFLQRHIDLLKKGSRIAGSDSDASPSFSITSFFRGYCATQSERHEPSALTTFDGFSIRTVFYGIYSRFQLVLPGMASVLWKRCLIRDGTPMR